MGTTLLTFIMYKKNKKIKIMMIMIIITTVFPRYIPAWGCVFMADHVVQYQSLLLRVFGSHNFPLGVVRAYKINRRVTLSTSFFYILYTHTSFSIYPFFFHFSLSLYIFPQCCCELPSFLIFYLLFLLFFYFFFLGPGPFFRGLFMMRHEKHFSYITDKLTWTHPEKVWGFFFPPLLFFFSVPTTFLSREREKKKNEKQAENMLGY